jgi:hypothetical protein
VFFIHVIMNHELPKQLDNTSVVVATHTSEEDILLGRDIMIQITKLKALLNKNRQSKIEFINDEPFNQSVRKNKYFRKRGRPLRSKTRKKKKRFNWPE